MPECIVYNNLWENGDYVVADTETRESGGQQRLFVNVTLNVTSFTLNERRLAAPTGIRKNCVVGNNVIHLRRGIRKGDWNYSNVAWVYTTGVCNECNANVSCRAYSSVE